MEQSKEQCHPEQCHPEPVEGCRRVNKLNILKHEKDKIYTSERVYPNIQEQNYASYDFWNSYFTIGNSCTCSNIGNEIH